jgi:DNA-binding PadR family transcriptional regulator
MHMPIGRVGQFCRHCCPECSREQQEQVTYYRLTPAGRKYLPKNSSRLEVTDSEPHTVWK